MRNRSWQPLLILLSLTLGCPAKAELDSDGFEHIALINHADVDVSLLLRPVATPADREFIGFLINNKTRKPLKPGQSAWYRIADAKRLDRATQAGVSTSSLASGNDYDLLYRDVINISADRPLLPAGQSRRMVYSSGYSLGLLGIPAPDSKGFTIKATVRMELIHAGQALATPPAGVPIQFDWLPPDEAGIKGMKQRLRDVLRGGDPGERQYYVMATLLDDPAIGSTMTTADLIAGLNAWEQRGDKILKYLDEHRKQDEGLVDYALAVIAKRDHLRMLVLRKSTSLHDARLIEPLKAWATAQSNNHGPELALELLSKQLDLAPNRDGLTAELGKTWLARSPITRANQLKATEEWRWTNEATRLALTRDRNLIPILLPYLDRKEVVVDAKMIAVVNSGISTRACDVAYNTILDLLERNDERFVLETGTTALSRRLDAQAEYGRRDALIAKLRNQATTR
jgi:hypothetical protein